MAWDVTVPDTFAESHLSSTAAEQEAACETDSRHQDCEVSGT